MHSTSPAFATAARDLLFPPVCSFCGVSCATADSAPLCGSCRERLGRDERPRCPRCCGLVPAFAPDCSRCGDWPRLTFAASACIGAYEYELREAVLRSKRAAEYPLAAALANLLVESLGETIAAWQVDRVVAMPMHWMRRFFRGANSPERHSLRLARAFGVRESSRILVRRRNTRPQASLPPSARQANVRGAFRIRRSRSLHKSRILLVDDVMTTGATCREAAATLLRAGAAAVFVAVLARADS